MKEIIPWVSLVVAFIALYHSVRKDSLQAEIQKIRKRGELKKRVTSLTLDFLPDFKNLFSEAKSKCKSCNSYYEDDYKLTEKTIAGLETWSSNLKDEIEKPLNTQNIIRIEECLSKIDEFEHGINHFRKIFQNRIECTKND